MERSQWRNAVRLGLPRGHRGRRCALLPYAPSGSRGRGAPAPVPDQPEPHTGRGYLLRHRRTGGTITANGDLDCDAIESTFQPFAFGDKVSEGDGWGVALSPFFFMDKPLE